MMTSSEELPISTASSSSPDTLEPSEVQASLKALKDYTDRKAQPAPELQRKQELLRKLASRRT
jgi:hypothetical protein